MLSTLFPRASRKCLELPLFGLLMQQGFEDWLVQQRYARLHIRALLRVVGKVDRYLRRRGIQRIEDITHLDLDHYWRTLRRRSVGSGSSSYCGEIPKNAGSLEFLSGHHTFCPSSGGILGIPAGGPRIDARHYRRADTSR